MYCSPVLGKKKSTNSRIPVLDDKDISSLKAIEEEEEPQLQLNSSYKKG